MALQGNPFLGKLKVPIPDLKKIPSAEVPKDSTQAPEPIDNFKISPPANAESTSPKTSSITQGNTSPFDDSAGSTLPSPEVKKSKNRQQITSKSLANKERIASESLANHKQIASEPLAIHQQDVIIPTKEDTQGVENHSGDELPANRQQTASNSPAESPANKERIASELPADLKPASVVRHQTASKSPAKSPAELPANHEQIASSLNSVLFLRGIQRKLAEFIYLDCRECAKLTTRPIAGPELAQYADSDIRTAKNAMDRLVEKQIVKRIQSYPGRLGSTIYGMPEPIYKEFLDLEKRGIHTSESGRIASKSLAKSPAESPAERPSSSSFNIYEDKKLTTTQNEKPFEHTSSDLPAEWQEIDYAELAEMGLQWSPPFHFGRPQLRQWYDRKYCSPQEAQESIQHFTFHLKQAPRGSYKTGPLNFFMGIMAKNRYFARPDGYLSPQELVLKERLDLERKASERRQEMQDELFSLLYEKWFDSLTGSEINALTPSLKGFDAKKETLRHKFWNEFYLMVRDNPTIDVRTLKLEIPAYRDLAEPPKVLNELQSSIDPLEQYRKIVAFLTEQIRELEDGLSKETRESLKSELKKSLSVVQKKRQQILDSNPTLADEVAEIDNAFKTLPPSQVQKTQDF